MQEESLNAETPEERDVLEASQAYADSKGFHLNEDKKILGMVIKALAKNKKGAGKAYCPCRPLEGNPAEDDKKVCPCAWHLKEIEEGGHCKCQLFFGK